MNPHLTSRLAGWSFTAFACAMLASAVARAQTSGTAYPAADHDTVQLDRYVVTASRVRQDPQFTPASISVITPASLSVSQIPDLRTALAAEPGVVLVQTGATGAQTSIFMRGSNSDQVLIMVDGIRMNSADTPYANFLGGADLVGIDRVEILRGPQSTLYGSSAMGGVIAINTTRGCGELQGVASATAGSFKTYGGAIAASGGTQTVGYSASVSENSTNNDRPDNRYLVTSYSSRLEWVARPGFLVGASLRGQQGILNEPGPDPIGYSSKGRAETPNHLVTAYAQWDAFEGFRSRLTAGWHQAEYTWTDKTIGEPGNYYFRNTRRVLDWQNSWQATSDVMVVAGAEGEWSHYSVDGATLSDRLAGVYLNGDYRPFDALSLTLGGRADDHKIVGNAETWRAGAAYRIQSTKTKLRATYGTGFKAPTMANRYGMPPWYAESRDLKPEKSKGWDAGVDQSFASGVFTASATYFQNRFTDLINNDYSVALGKYVATNVKSAKTEGIEVALASHPVSTVELRVAYTYLSAMDTSDTQHEFRLIRRPRHTGDFDVHWSATSAWTIGSGFHFVASRLTTSSATSSIVQEDYTTARLYTSYRVTPQLTLKVRVENALDEKYAEAVGYAALPRACYGSVEWKF